MRYGQRCVGCSSWVVILCPVFVQQNLKTTKNLTLFLNKKLVFQPWYLGIVPIPEITRADHDNELVVCFINFSWWCSG